MNTHLPQIENCLIIGANGFIGTAVHAESLRRGLKSIPIHRTNYADYVGTECDVLINANGNAKKYLDADNPLQGFDLSVRSVLQSCLDFKPRHYVLLSSGAIYPDEANPENNREETPLCPSTLTSDYAFHKWLAEQMVQRHAPSHTILRLGGFVGPRLAKNAVYDVLTNTPLRVRPDSEFQLMDTRDLARLVFEILGQQPTPQETYNLSALGTVSMRTVSEWAGHPIRSAHPDVPRVRSELNIDKVSKYVALPTSEETTRSFVHEFKAGKLEIA